MNKYLITVSIFLCLTVAIPMASASDYFVYSILDTEKGAYGVDGYVGQDGIDRIIFYSANTATASIYTVTIPLGSNPNTHPSNPDATGAIAPRTFNFEKSFDLGVNPGHESEFYVDAENNVIYLGASEGIRKYVYNPSINNYVFNSQVAPPSPVMEWTQSLAYDPDTDTWYAGSMSWNDNPGITPRHIWKYDGSQGDSGIWVLAFQYYTSHPSPMGHHDGMEFIKGHLYLADYQGDYIYQYTTTGTLVKEFTHDPLTHELEGMGFGALKHFWAGSHGDRITEFGGGTLQVEVEGISDQCVPLGNAFDTFDLDDYATGTPSFVWTYSGNTNLAVSIDGDNVVTITNPGEWTGSETITFTLTDSSGIASEDVIFTVSPIPIVGDIPDQTTPFTTFDLDDYLLPGSASPVTWSASDPGSDWTVVIDVDNVVTVTALPGASDPVTITFTATASACSNEVSDSDDAIFTPNRPPVADANGPYTGDEGSSITFDASGSIDLDLGDSIVSYEWDLDNDGEFDDATGVDPIATWNDDYSGTITLRVTDSNGATDTDSTTVTVSNVAPTVGPITAPMDPVAVNTPITASALFTDPGTDTHVAEWDWGDGTTPGTVGCGSVTDSHTYITPGVYTITLTVTDDDGGVGSSVYQYVVVYDPSAGFVTGGGWINSPSGAYIDPTCTDSCPDPTGKANFGFVSKYKKGATSPTGQTQFQFMAGDLNFHSDSYDWLVIAGAHAKYKGTGTINGVDNYGFMLTATDGQINGGGDIDKFRIKIWIEDESDVNNGFVVYDNLRGLSDDDNSGTALEGGSIVIHTMK